MALAPLNVIGNSNNRDQHSKRILTGQMDFAADRLAGCKLYGAAKTSTIAHGKIKSMDVTKALKEPGVKAVLTYKDVPSWSETVTWWGQDIAGVVADNWYTAKRAATLIEVTYETSPMVFDPEAAMQKDSPLSGILPSSNTKQLDTRVRGDITAGFLNADIVLTSNSPWTGTWQHNMLEQHQAVAWWVGEHLYVWQGSQGPHCHQIAIARTLGIPGNRVHFYSHGCGGGLGDRSNRGDLVKCWDHEGVIAAVMSKKVGGAPVLFLESKRENMTMHSRQFAARADIKLGAKKDGTIVAADVKAFCDLGSLVTNFYVTFYGLKNTYTIPNYNHNVTGIVTNSPIRGPWRCIGDPPAAVCYDMALDKLAAELSMDPYQMRMKNLRATDAPDQDPPYLVWGGNGVGLCFKQVHDASGYDGKWHAPSTKTLPDGRLHGIAITGHLDSHGTIEGGGRGGLITITTDGRCLANVGGGRASSGAETTMVHFVAEALGMKYDDVACGDWGATDTSLDGGRQTGSRFTAGAGSAFYNAAMDARGQLFAVALTKAPFNTIPGITAKDLDAKDSSIFLKSDSTKAITYTEVMNGAPPIAGRGVGWNGFMRNKSVGGVAIGERCNCSGSAATCAEVAVDHETGEVEVLGIWNAVDTGRTIYKNGALREISSGAELQISQALFFGDIYDVGTGACISSQYTESMLPTFMDINTQTVNAQDIESDDAGGPYGAHGIGEPCATNYSCIINAIFNATGKWVDMDKGSCTPNKVLKALGKA